eukprot:1494643-Prymnesium_polylepis.1
MLRASAPAPLGSLSPSSLRACLRLLVLEREQLQERLAAQRDAVGAGAGVGVGGALAPCRL